MSADPQRVPALDGVRGLAIALVVGFHAGFVPAGWVGVSLFFALSGYLITGLLLNEHTRTSSIDLRSFYRRRFIRLAPALLVALLGMCVLWQVLAPAANHAVRLDALLVLLYFGNVAHAISATALVPVGWAWSLALEEQFYALWPPLLRRALRHTSLRTIGRRLVLAAAGIVAARLLVTDSNLSYILVRGDELLLGAAVALLGWRTRWAVLAIPLLALSALHPFDVRWGVTLGSLASVGVLLAVLSSPTVARAFSLRPLRYLGRISYALYLWDGILTEVPVGRLPHAAAVVTALAVVLAAASTHLIEDPLRARSRARGRRRVVQLSVWSQARVWSQRRADTSASSASAEAVPGAHAA